MAHARVVLLEPEPRASAATIAAPSSAPTPSVSRPAASLLLADLEQNRRAHPVGIAQDAAVAP